MKRNKRSSRSLDVSYYHLLCAKMTREFCYLTSTIGLTSFCTVPVYTKLKLMVAMERPTTSLSLSGHSGTFINGNNVAKFRIMLTRPPKYYVNSAVDSELQVGINRSRVF